MSKLKYFDGTNWNVVNGQILGDTLPIGSIVPYGSETAPTNWLVCDGSAVSRTTYAELFNAIGTTFGAGDGSTTFNLPNLKGKVPVGRDSTQTEFDTMGETGGEKKHTLTQNELPSSITMNFTTSSHKDSGTPDGQYLGYGTTTDIKSRPYTFTNNSFGQAHNILQPYQVVCYIIKAKQSAGVVANVSNTYSTSETDTYACSYVNDAVLDNYSENETIVGSWTSGSAINKTIYRKILTRTTSISAGTEVSVGSAITNFGAPVNMYGFVYSSSLGYLPVNLINVAAQTYSCFAYVKSNGTIALRPNFAVDSAYIVLEYIKTTD